MDVSAAKMKKMNAKAKCDIIRPSETREKTSRLGNFPFLRSNNTPTIKRGRAKVSFVTDAVKIASNEDAAKRIDATEASRRLPVNFLITTRRNNVVREPTRGIKNGIKFNGEILKTKDAIAPKMLTAGQQML
jgi:hypothetical protein